MCLKHDIYRAIKFIIKLSKSTTKKKFPPAVCPILVHHLYSVVNAKLRHGIQQ